MALLSLVKTLLIKARSLIANLTTAYLSLLLFLWYIICVSSPNHSASWSTSNPRKFSREWLDILQEEDREREK